MCETSQAVPVSVTNNNVTFNLSEYSQAAFWSLIGFLIAALVILCFAVLRTWIIVRERNRRKDE